MTVQELLDQDMTKEAGFRAEAGGAVANPAILGLLGAIAGGTIGGSDGAVAGGLIGGYGGLASNYIGSAIGGLRKHDRDPEEQEEVDEVNTKNILKNLLIPGHAAHDLSYRNGTLLDNVKNTIKD